MALGIPATAAILAASSLNAGAKILEHVSDGPPWIPGAWWSPSKAVLWLVLAGVLVLVGIRRAVAGYDKDGAPRTRWAQMIDPFVQHFYRDVALPFTGEKYAPKVAPLLLSFFFFILTCNLLGLVPISDALGLVMSWVMTPEALHSSAFYAKVVEGGSTPTGNFNVTVGLAAVTFVAIVVFGAREHGFAGHWSHLMPKGYAFPVRLLLLFIETLSMFVKPFALTMRLAANMTAGHMGLLALLLMPAILRATGITSAGAIAAGVPVALLAVGVMLLEIIVCFVQAYVFALLSGVFIGMAIHSH